MMPALERGPNSTTFTRRNFLRLAVGGTVGLAAACAPAAPPTQPAAPARPAAIASPVAPASPAPRAAAAKGPLDVVRRGNLRGITFGAAIAKARGYFEQVGVDDQETVFASGTEQAQALAAGQLDMGATSMTAAAFNLVARGVKQPMVCDNWTYARGSGANMLVVRADLADSIKQLPDLKGRTMLLSTPLRDGTVGIVLKRMLEGAGMSLDDVHYERLAFPDMLAGLANRSADAAMMIEPFITQGEQRQGLVRWLDLGDFDTGAQTAAVIFSERLVTERNDVAKRWMVANLRGTRDYEDFRRGKQREALAPILAKHTGLPEDVVLKVRFPEVNPDGYLNVAWIEGAQRQLLEWGTVNQPVPMGQIVDHQFVDYAIQQIGRYSG